MNIKLIKTEADYQAALKRLEEFFDARIGTIQSDEADILGLMIDEYEKKHYQIDAPDPIEAIKIRMEEMQLKQKDLADVNGGKKRVSEVFNRKRKLTLEIIRNLTIRLNLSPGLFKSGTTNSGLFLSIFNDIFLVNNLSEITFVEFI